MFDVVETTMSDKVREFIAKPRMMLIDGKWVPAASGKTFPVYNPANGDVIAQVAEGDPKCNSHVYPTGCTPSC